MRYYWIDRGAKFEEKVEDIKMGVEDYKPIIVMVGCQFLYAGTNLFVRAALLEEMSSRVFVVYRQFIGFLLISPFAYFSRYELKLFSKK